MRWVLHTVGWPGFTSRVFSVIQCRQGGVHAGVQTQQESRAAWHMHPGAANLKPLGCRVPHRSLHDLANALACRG
jgi:hypothetical protein